MTENDTLQNIADSLATEAPKVETQSSDLQNIADELSAPKQEEVKEEIVAEQKTEVAEEKKEGFLKMRLTFVTVVLKFRNWALNIL